MKRRSDAGGTHIQSHQWIEDLRVVALRGHLRKRDWAKSMGMTESAFERKLCRMRKHGLLLPGRPGQQFFEVRFADSDRR